MEIRLYLLVLLFLTCFNGLAQTEGIKDYHPPLGIPLVLSSNFGELRTNHFHMGVDFKTNMKTGYRLYAIEDGYVSRIKVSPYGYGKVIYIDHPNGITSVYAHCSEFKGQIDSLVQATQQAEQNFEIELFPAANSLPVKKGEVIALSGNSGSSTAPHLHFELRDTKTEHALNPLLFGFDIADNKAPEIRGVKVYGVDADGYIFENRETSKSVIKGNSGYALAGNNITINADFCSANGGIGFAFDVIDRLDAASNQCGLYGSYLLIDGDTIFSQAIKRIPFESTRFINTHMDYNAFHLLRKHYHKSYRTSINNLPIYQTEKNKGIFKATPGRTYDVLYIAYDLKGNESTLNFSLTVNEGTINNQPSVSDGKNFLDPSRVYSFLSDDCELEFDRASVYEPLFINEEQFCGEVFDSKYPVHNAFKIKFRNPYNDDGHSYITVRGNNLKSRALKTTVSGEWIMAESTYFGAFEVVRDFDAPRIIPVNILNRTNFLSNKQLIWNISDNGSGLSDYDLYINGKWYLTEFESKGNILSFAIPSDLKGLNELQLIVKDACGNEAIWNKTVEFL